MLPDIFGLLLCAREKWIVWGWQRRRRKKRREHSSSFLLGMGRRVKQIQITGSGGGFYRELDTDQEDEDQICVMIACS